MPSNNPKVISPHDSPLQQARIIGDNIDALWQRATNSESTIGGLQSSVSSIESIMANLSIQINTPPSLSFSVVAPLVISGSVISLDYTGNFQLTAFSLDTIQDIKTTDSPTFAGLSLTGFAGAVSATAGVLAAGTLSVAYGGTGATTLTDGGLLLGSGVGAITPLGQATNGQLPIGSAGADPVLAAITGTANRVTVTNGAGTITLSAPQDIHAAASPTFAGLTLSGLTGVLTGNGAGAVTASTGTQNYVMKWGAANAVASSLMFDDGNGVVIGHTTPLSLFDVGSTSVDPIITINYRNTDNVGDPQIHFAENSVNVWSMGMDTGAINRFVITPTAAGVGGQTHFNMLTSGTVGFQTGTFTNILSGALPAHTFKVQSVASAVGFSELTAGDGAFVIGNAAITGYIGYTETATGTFVSGAYSNHAFSVRTNNLPRLHISANGLLNGIGFYPGTGGVDYPVSIWQIGWYHSAETLGASACNIQGTTQNSSGATSETVLKLCRRTDAATKYGMTVDFNMYPHTGAGLAPATQLDIVLKSGSNHTQTGNVIVMSLLDTGYVYMPQDANLVIGLSGDSSVGFNGTDMIVDYDVLNAGTTDYRVQENGTDRFVILTGSGQVQIDGSGNPVIEKTSGIGIKVDTAAPTFGWRDILGEVIIRNTGASKPTYATYRDTVSDYQFAVNDEESFDYHIPHDYVEGTDILLHVHWSHIGTLVTGGTVTFEYEITYAKGHNQAAFPATVTTTFNGTASTTQYQHIITEIQISATSPSAVQIDSDDLEPDGIIICRFKVTANGITVSGGGVPDPFIHYVDIHYQSTNIGTKQNAPDFYT